MEQPAYYIHNEFLKATINAKGAEWCSLFDNEKERELLWQANPEFWPRHAPILFPFVGELQEGSFVWNGNEYTMGRHGFARELIFTKIDSEDNYVTLRLTDVPSTLEIYPFPFSLTITFRLEGKKIIQTMEICNTGARTMPYSIGGHPAFNADPIEDYSIIFDREEYHETRVIENGLLSPLTKPGINGKELALHRSVFNHDAFVFTRLKSNRFTLKHRYNGDILTLDKGNFPHLGIWSKPTAPFVCIEPWQGTADFEGERKSVFEKFGIIALKPGEMKKHYFSVMVH